MNKTLRIGCTICIMLVFGVFVGCSDDDTPTNTNPPPEPHLAGSIGVYADAQGTDRNVEDTGQAVTVYVIHKVEDGSTASAFTVEAPAGWRLIGEQSEFIATIGDIVSGVSIGYGECLTGTIHLMTLNYMSPGNSAPGSVFEVKPHPHWPDVLTVVDCNYEIVNDGVMVTSPVVIPQ